MAMWAASPAATPLARKTLKFPRDTGAHPDFKTEWWYLTGFAHVGTAQAALGFQVTFFRSRVDATQAMQSPLAARQLLFAHAAVTDVQGKKLWHDQRIARWSGAAPGERTTDTASASIEHTAIHLRDWSLTMEGATGRGNARPALSANVVAADFSLDLQLASTQAVLLQGDQGLSRKGPDAAQASYYYSRPQLQVQGSIAVRGKRYAVGSGSTAWLDHEWSQALLDPHAVGWDWIGINLLDGSALTAFQLRDKDGQALWDGGSFRSGNSTFAFSRGEVLFKPLRQWRSALSNASYPVEWMVRTPADYYTVQAVVDNQELDSRQSTGAIYWEGLCEVWDSNSKLVGRGYLEMTGYAGALTL
jgi:predicted secreted hydrolase